MEDSNSWLRRTKYSHTVCHRFDTSKLAAYLSSDAGNDVVPIRVYSQIQVNPVINKQRSVSPSPQITKVPDSFKDAKKTIKRRHSTPNPRMRKDHHHHQEPSSNGKGGGGIMNKWFHHGGKQQEESLKQLKKNKRGGKVNSVEDSEECCSSSRSRVDMSKLFIGLRFAHGAHSRLYHGIYNDQPVAVKIIREPDDDDNGALGVRLKNQFDREVSLLTRLSHPNVIKLVAACKKTPVYCVITEYLSEGSLRAYLHKLEHKSLAMEKLIAFALDIARGMEYIHSRGVIHRDLKPENILIDEDSHLKIADFGIACEEACCDKLADDPGTYRWMAPEMIKKKSYSRKVDVYGFGLMLWEMVTGTIPYEEMNPIQAAFAVVNKNLRPVVPSQCPPALKALMEQCWSLQPEKRPEFWQIVKVLEQFETSLATDGNLNLVKSPSYGHDHKKGLAHWIQKLSPVVHHPPPSTSPTSKPKFM